MNIADQSVVSFHYVLTNDEGETVDSSREREQPMLYMHGANNIIKGLERAMAGRAAGDTFKVSIEPGDAYGTRTEANVQRLTLKKLGLKSSQLEPGTVLNLQTKKGPAQVTVLKVGRFNVDVDANHPLSGQRLHFDVEIMEVREATEEEKQHGHAHGPGGHHHH